jgi:hypothetical protein
MQRKCEIKIRFSENELQSLDKKVAKTGMSREGYARCVLSGKTPVEIPPADYFALLREVRALGNNMNQVAYKANSMGLLDAPMYRRITTIRLPRDD